MDKDKEQIIIDGVDVYECKFLVNRFSNNTDYCCSELNNTLLKCPKRDCYFKQLQKEKFENLNNRQMVKNAENLIYENSELYKNLKEKEQECEELKEYLQANQPTGICETCMATAILQNDKYNKALKEIEEVAELSYRPYTACGEYNERCSILENILDIINKAKGRLNEE